MLKLFVKSREAGLRLVRVSKDESGVVSFEYVIVAACIVGAVSLAFGRTAAGGIGLVLTNAITAIGTAVTAAI